MQFAVAQADVYADDLVVLDEFGSNLNMTRRYARAERGQRAFASLPATHLPIHHNLVAQRRRDWPEHAVSGWCEYRFVETYIEKVLRTSLRRGQTGHLDNLQAQKNVLVPQIVGGPWL